MAETPQALEAPRTSVEPPEPVQWLRSRPVLAIGLLLILAQVWWRAGLLGKSFFRLDDYLYLEHAAGQGLTWNYLFWVDGGHMDVVGSAVVWALERLSPLDWTLASAATLVLLACTSFALLRMLRTLFGDRPGVLLVLALYMLSPLSLPGLSWWTVTLEQLPLQLAIFCTVTAHVHYLRTRRFWHAIAAAAWLAVAMLSSFQGAAVLFLLFAITSAFYTEGFTEGGWARALWPTLRAHWRAWTLYAALTGAYVALYLVRLTTSTVGPSKPTFSNFLNYAGTLLRKTFVPGAFGGPWRWIASGVQALAYPPSALAWISWVLAVVVVVVSLMYAWRSWRAWAILAGWFVVVDIVPVLAGRSSFISVSVLGLSARYAWDAIAILALCLGLAFMPLVGAPGPSRSPRRLSRAEFAAATTIVVAIICGSLWSFYDYPADPSAAAARSYIATARAAFASAPPGTVIVDDPVPSYDVTGGPFLGQPSMASSVLSPMRSDLPGSRPPFVSQPDGTYSHLMEFNGYGQLVSSVIYGVTSQPKPKGGACWPSAHGRTVVRLNKVATNASTLRIGYLSADSGQMRVTFGTRTALYNFQAGDKAAYLPIQGASSGTVVITHVSGTLPWCIGDAEAGAPVPANTGPAYPVFPVSG